LKIENRSLGAAVSILNSQFSILNCELVAKHWAKGQSALRRSQRLGWSRNKVAVPEGAAGSPPF